MVMKNWAGEWVLFLAAFCLYLHGAAPSVSVGDAGEFITAASTLGVPHPSGFPTYTVLAKSVSFLLPWGNPGYRVNCFSVFAGALCVSVLFLFLRSIGLSLPACLFAALLWMGAPVQKEIACVTEVFALHALFLAALLWTASRGQWLLAAFLLGLGVGNHQTLALAVPALIVCACLHPDRASWNWKRAIACVGF